MNLFLVASLAGLNLGLGVNLIDSACNCGVNLKCEDRQGKFVVDR